MNAIEEKRARAEQLEAEARMLREEAKKEEQKSCTHPPEGWVEWCGKNVGLHRTCPLCEKVEVYNDATSEWDTKVFEKFL